MALSLLISFGTALGASEGIKASMAKSRREEHRSRKNNLVVHCPKSSQFSPYLEGRQVVLSGDRLFVDTGTAHNVPFGHPFEGYYLPYPESRFSGLVSTITHEAPIMNWIFVDPVSYQLRFGNRAAADGNLTGPWECTRQDRRLTLCGWEGFCAVLEESGVWGLYFDCDGDGLHRKFYHDGRVVIEIELLRREMRTRKPELVFAEPSSQQKEQSDQGGEAKDTSPQSQDRERNVVLEQKENNK
ncbi:hypothetical protein LZ31DRAFT_478672 [Colletotrichum somersetense]|nr:hypothetical protein LZ31DRAFT_478672 [Colletotrichum somersetense]